MSQRLVQLQTRLVDEEGDPDHEESDDGSPDDESSSFPSLAAPEDDPDAEQSAEPVLVLRCKACAAVLCRRAMRVTLLSDPSLELFSTDFASPSTIRAASPRALESCACRVVDLLCAACTRSRRAGSRAVAAASARGLAVGYHVVAPCAQCLDGEHNSHYFMFSSGAVDALPWPAPPGGPALTWGRLGLFDGLRPPLVLAGGGEAALPAELTCRICLGVLRDAARVRACGHTFCEACVLRHVDRRGQCPLDRRPASALDVLPDLGARAAVGRLRVHCRYGCARDPGPTGPAEPAPGACGARCADWEAGLAADAWGPSADPAACAAVCALSRVAAHERRCPKRCTAHGRRAGAAPGENSRAGSRRLRRAVCD